MAKKAITKIAVPKKAAPKKKAADADSLSWKVLDKNGKEVGSLELAPQIFGATVEPSLVHETVRWQRARKRAGTRQALTRSMMKGGKKKPWKQKGTGRARAGSSVSPLWVGGASIHGPLPRDYDYRLSKRSRRQALAAVLSDKVRQSTLFVIDEVMIKSGKTKDIVALLEKVGLPAGRVTLVVPELSPELERASRNIGRLQVLPVAGVNVYDLMRNQYLLSTKAGIDTLTKRLSSEKN